MLKFYLLYLIFLISTCAANAQVVSNSGTEFWTLFPSHEPDFDKNFHMLYANYSLFITASQPSSGVVTCGLFKQVFGVLANSVTEIKIPRSEAYIDALDAGKALAGKAIHVVVDPGQPKVVIYAHIFAGQRSAASLILPKEALGKQYYSINFKQYGSEGKNYIALAAVEPGTRLHIKKNNADLIPGGIYLANAGDVYEYLSDDDLTGVSVSIDAATGCNRFAMFTGSTGVKIGRLSCQPASLDPLFQQAYPIESWGQNYGFVPFSTQSSRSAKPVRTAGQYLCIIAREDNTHVNIDRKPVATLAAGQWYRSSEPLTKPAIITADKPVCVAQYALSQSCSSFQAPKDTASKDYSDPDMVILNPLEYAIKNITVYSSVRENIKEQYINILMPTEATGSFTINGTAPAGVFQKLSSAPEYSYLQLDLSTYNSNTFNLAAAKGFNAIAYGFGDVESYAYSAGTALNGSQAITGIRKADNQAIDSACVNDGFFFKLTLPYAALSITHQMDDAEKPIIEVNPLYDKVTIGQNEAYEYSFPRTAAYQHTGTHHIQIEYEYANSGSCNLGQQHVDYLFKVNPVATLGIGVVQANCPNVFNFTALCDLPESDIKSRLWDFGDSSPLDTARQTEHTYAKAATYTITLSVNLKTGCQSTMSRSIYIDPGLPLPVVAFDSLSDVCLTAQPYQLTAHEINGVAGSGIYIGDGLTAAGVFNPALAGIGKHLLKYTFTTLNGCQCSKTQTVEVLAAPEAQGFTVYVMEGKSLVLKPGYKGTNLTYIWSPVTGLSNALTAYPYVTPSVSTNFNVTVSNGACSGQAIIKVIVLKPLGIPNTFTPNGDGINDIWTIKNVEYFPHLTVNVFNRYGALVFHSTGYAKPWEGRLNGKDVPTGVYYYTITPGFALTPVTGSLTLIR